MELLPAFSFLVCYCPLLPNVSPSTTFAIDRAVLPLDAPGIGSAGTALQIPSPTRRAESLRGGISHAIVMSPELIGVMVRRNAAM